MIAFALYDFDVWRERRMRAQLIIAALVLLPSGLVGPVHPGFLYIAITAVFLLIGWSEGSCFQPLKQGRQALLDFPRRPALVITGKALSMLINWACLCVALSPLIALSAIAWGSPLSFIVISLLCSLLASLASGSLGLLLSFFMESAVGLAGFLFLALWTFPCFSNRAFGIFNPFFQIHELSMYGNYLGVALGLGAELVLVCLLFSLAALALRRSRGNRHA